MIFRLSLIYDSIPNQEYNHVNVHFLWLLCFLSIKVLVTDKDLFVCRICLDDNHYSVALACAKVIQCILTCDVNENYFDLSEVLSLFFPLNIYFLFFLIFVEYISVYNIFYLST